MASNDTRAYGRPLAATLAATLLLSVGAPASVQERAPDRPPVEAGSFRKVDLVNLGRFDETLRLDVRYATPNNFLGRAVYRQARVFLQRDAAEALRRAN